MNNALIRSIALALAVYHVKEPTNSSGDVLGVAREFLQWINVTDVR